MNPNRDKIRTRRDFTGFLRAGLDGMRSTKNDVLAPEVFIRSTITGWRRAEFLVCLTWLKKNLARVSSKSTCPDNRGYKTSLVSTSGNSEATVDWKYVHAHLIAASRAVVEIPPSDKVTLLLELCKRL
jgi:hypothetical protein